MPYEDPIAFLITWSTYGTWLPGDGRGWVEYRRGFQLPDQVREMESAARMTEDACRLSPAQRDRVERQVAETCGRRDWTLHAVNCRSNHIHVVVSASAAPRTIRGQLKAWATRRLKEQEAAAGVSLAHGRTQWWAERGSIRWIFHEADLGRAIVYVCDEQDNPARFAAPTRK